MVTPYDFDSNLFIHAFARLLPGRIIKTCLSGKPQPWGIVDVGSPIDGNIDCPSFVVLNQLDYHYIMVWTKVLFANPADVYDRQRPVSAWSEVKNELAERRICVDSFPCLRWRWRWR